MLFQLLPRSSFLLYGVKQTGKIPMAKRWFARVAVLVDFASGKAFAQDVKGVFHDEEGVWVVGKDQFFQAFYLHSVGDGQDDAFGFAGVGSGAV